MYFAVKSFVLAAGSVLAAPLALADGGPGSLRIDPDRITVSGMSSGGNMANQLHLAYSDLFRGAGIIAGGPFGCAAGSLATALSRCTGATHPALPVNEFAAEIEAAAADGRVAPLAHLAADRVWLFHGSLDTVVSRAVSDALAQLYATWLPGGQMTYVTGIPAAHHFPTTDRGTACEVSQSPFLGACGYDAAGELLNHLYPGLTAAESTPAGEAEPPMPERTVLDGAATAGLAAEAWLFVPRACRDGSAACALHLVLHGCAQSVSQVGMTFIEQSGFLRWAAANDIVLAFPQTVSSPANPLACWDWWGYTGPDYRWRNGAQMQVLADWIKALSGVQPVKPTPAARHAFIDGGT